MRAVRRSIARVRRRLRSERGWTLTEMLFAILVSTLVLGAATTFLTGVASLNVTTNHEIQAQDDARRAVDHLGTQLRNATGPPGSAPIYSPAAGSSGGTTDLIFYVPSPSAGLTNNPRGLQWVRYCLDYSTLSNEKLWMQTAAYDSTQLGPPVTSSCPSGAWGTQQLVLSNIVNKASTPVTTLFTQGEDAQGAIHDIQVRLLVQGDAARKATAITSSLEFRNAKSAPAAVISCQVQNGHGICDASKSTDPDGEALSYKWKRTGDATWESGQTSYLFDTGQLSSGAYTVTVEVTDASGLYTDATQTVTIP
jgi:hypothetical protein